MKFMITTVGRAHVEKLQEVAHACRVTVIIVIQLQRKY